jgi:eukaryotic-like serine/threonine-protein kinase
MSQKHDPLEAIFNAALEFTGSERELYLARACGNDASLRQRVEKLLRALEEVGGFLGDAEGEAVGPAVTPSGESHATWLMPVTEEAGDRIGRYKLLERLGEGGCGVVYVAAQEEPVRRRVALKVIKLGMDTKSVLARFEAERQALALMDHPNIAKVFDAGTTETGRPYFVMELVRGLRITDYCDQNNLPTHKRLELFIHVCHAIQHAHQKGIIHRDIKPSNILVTLHDGVPVPKVIDFGIAKATEGRLTDATLYTQLHQFVGTPAYMSPEQAEMSGLDMDTRSDIYSLGVLLYELLTGRTPFDANELMSRGIDVMRQTIREREPLRPSTRVAVLKGEERTTTAKRRSAEVPKLITLLKGDLDWIAMKCLEKDRARRYETANGLASDIERHLKSEPVLARPPSTVYRVQKFVRRNKLMVSAGAAVAAALVLGVTVSTWLAVRERQHRERAEASEQQALRMQVEAETAHAREHDQRELAEAHAYAADMNLAQQALLSGNWGKVHSLLERYRPGTGLEHLRGFEWRYLAAQASGDADAMDTSSEDQVTGIDLSPDDRRLAVSRFGGTIELRDPATLEVKGRLQTKAPLSSCGAVFSPQGNLLAASSEGGVIRLWRSDTLELVRELPNSHAVLCLRFTPDGRHLAAFIATRPLWPTEGEVRIWDVQSGQVARQYSGFRDGQLCFSPDGRHLAVADPPLDPRIQDGIRIRILDWMRDTEVTNFLHPVPFHNRVISLAHSPDGELLASAVGPHAGSIRLWRPLTGEPVGMLEGHRGWVTDLVFSPDGRRLVSSSADQTIRIWDLSTRETVRTLRGHRGQVHRVALSRDGETLFSGSKDGRVAQWRIDTDPRWDRRVELSLSVSGYWASLLENGRALASLLRPDPYVALYTVANEPREVVLHALGSRNDSLWTAPRLGLLACQKQNGIVEVWCLRQGGVVASFAPEVELRSGGFHAEESRFIMIESLEPDQLQARIWDTQSWQELRRLLLTVPVYPHGYRPMPISPDGRMLLCASPALGQAVWFNLETGQKLGETLHPAGISNFAFSPDGQTLVAACRNDDSVTLWNVDTRQPIARWIDQRTPLAVAFSPDGSRLAVGHSGDAEGEAVSLWDLRTRRELVTLLTPGFTFDVVQFSADGSSLLTRPLSGGPFVVWRPPSLVELDGEVDAAESMQADTQRETLWELALTLNRRPRIAHHPEPMLLEAGGTAEFRVQVAGEGRWICQWQHDGMDLPGATNTMLRLESVSLRQAGEYQALILSATEPQARFAMSEPASLQIREGNLRYGALRLETYGVIPGVLVSDLTNHHTFPDQADSIEPIGRFEIASDRAHHYGARLTGYLIPPVTGDYVLYLASDEESILYLSPNEDARRMRAVAREVRSAPRQWRKPETLQPNEFGRVSSPVPLEAGRRYYVEVLHKEGAGDDHLAVAWQLPGEPPPSLGAPPIPGRYLACDDPGKANVEHRTAGSDLRPITAR